MTLDAPITQQTTDVVRASVAGHFGELLQGRIGAHGPVALITLPCPVLQVHAERRPGRFALHAAGTAIMTPDQVRAFLVSLGGAVKGAFHIRSDLQPGAGCGSSTALRVALARAAGAMLTPMHLAQACVAHEGASDPLMFAAPERLLWASREGRILGRLPGLPALEVVGGLFGPPQRTDARDSSFADISDLAAAWPAACGSAQDVAALASQSAQRSLALRGMLDTDPTASLARQLGALGWATAHTGSARSLLFAPGSVPAWIDRRLQDAGLTRTVSFQIGGAA